jgi:hypothetical protein
LKVLAISDQKIQLYFFGASNSKKNQMGKLMNFNLIEVLTEMRIPSEINPPLKA